MKRIIIIPSTAPDLLKIYIGMYNLCNSDEQKVLAIHSIYNLGYFELAEALTILQTGQSINFQSYVNTITPNWEYIQTGRAAIKARQNKWSIRNLYRFAKKWKSKVKEAFRKTSTRNNGSYLPA